MNTQRNMYKRYRFPAEIIRYAVWVYYRFNLSHRDVEDLLAERGITVSHESIRLWCNKFGPKYARRLKRRHQGFGDTFFIDEVFVKIGGKQRFLGVHAAVYNLFNLGRHLVGAEHYRNLRISAFNEWGVAAA